MNSHHVLGDTGSLQFLKSESTATTILDVVLESRASDDRPQRLDRSGSNFSGLSSTSLAAAVFPGGLVEPGLNITVPILVEMGIGDHLIPFGRHFEAIFALPEMAKKKHC